MRTPAVLGASLLLLASLAVASPAAALPSSHGHWDGRDDTRTGAEWDGGSGWADGERYEWPDDTRSWGDDVCPDMDEPKTDVRGEEQTITLSAPEGQLISAYCVKAGSAKRGDGPKVVTLDEPVAEVTIAYPTDGKCRAISHYAVAYVDAPQPEETAPPADEETTPPTDEATTPPTDDATTPPAEEPTPPTDDATTPPAEETTPPTDEPTQSPSPSTLPTAPTDGETPGMGGADYVDDEPEARADTASASLARSGGADTVAAAPESLPVTGAQVLGIAMAAVALIGAGVGVTMYARQRRSA
ncbi:hypothetical protein M1843_14245 [Isoptericola sp. 4D.3]|uniref:Uncharacterized protein n=1 Tax=Isoptericola peretonis TaxID=2918523 RepID=A0ABT0J5X7_9MICO|nr:hypothetical protein [Isoptericola sp. 4D.3]